jgi:ABC-type transport system involved in multi-copper enzyme maturation permease subunit
VLIFDEPYNGMDPEGIVWMKGFLRALGSQGRTVLVSSHLVGELEDTAGHLVIVGRGRVIADTSVADLLAAASGNRIMLRTTAPADAMTALAGAGLRSPPPIPACSQSRTFHQNEWWRSWQPTPSPSARSPPAGSLSSRHTWNSPGSLPPLRAAAIPPRPRASSATSGSPGPLPVGRAPTVGGFGPNGVAVPGTLRQSAGALAVTSSGDISPLAGDGMFSRSSGLAGTPIGLIPLIVVGAMFITAEYRRGLIRVSLTASPRRGRLLAAKAMLVGAVSFVTGLIAATFTVAIGARALARTGVPIWPVPALAKARMVVGTAALLAVAAVLTLAIGTVARRGATASAAQCQSATCGIDPAKVSFTGIYVGQAVAAVAGVLAIGDEYSTGMIKLSLTAVPRRLTWFFAKAAVLTGPVLAASACRRYGHSVSLGEGAASGRTAIPGWS